ncbi:MAG: hypothetical protein ACYS8Z_20785, partial [Planctomycetota bacterium]
MQGTLEKHENLVNNFVPAAIHRFKGALLCSPRKRTMAGYVAAIFSSKSEDKSGQTAKYLFYFPLWT